MNLNYVGSVAERFMKFRSRLAETEGVAEDLFNAISIYVPKSLAQAQLSADAYDPAEVTADKYAVIAVTVDNYKDVLADGSVLLSQWLPVFNDGTNFAVKLYVIVFDDTGFAPTVTAGAITWQPLTKAFNELYFISLFKTMFSEHYDGSKVESDPAQATDYDDSNYFDMALALAYQCELESTLSWHLAEIKLSVYDGVTDTNACKIQSLTRGDETQHCTTLEGSTLADRAEYFWGYLNLMGGTHTELIIHNGNYLVPVILGRWFEEKNESGQFIGNKLCKIRLTGNKVKPTGNPSPLNSDVNLNLPSSITDILDSKNVGYFISIANNSDSNAELIRDRSVSNMPATAYAISKWVDYTTSQDMAKYATAISTLTNPVLVNKETYAKLQSFLVNNLAKFATTGRITNIQVKFPPFAEAKQGNWFMGTAVWSAMYVDDLEGVNISGSISF
jgi:hypothetical protein